MSYDRVVLLITIIPERVPVLPQDVNVLPHVGRVAVGSRAWAHVNSKDTAGGSARCEHLRYPYRQKLSRGNVKERYVVASNCQDPYIAANADVKTRAPIASAQVLLKCLCVRRVNEHTVCVLCL